MPSKSSLFSATLQYSFLQFFPVKKNDLPQCFKQIFSDYFEDIFCQDILELWADLFDIGGLILGSTALFLTGLLIMTAADIIIFRTGSPIFSFIIRIVCGLYCFEKFKGKPSNSFQNYIILIYIGASIIWNFYWSLTMIFLIIFINAAAYRSKGGKLC